MAIHTDNMSTVSAPGERPDEGWYLGRVSEVREGLSKEKQQPIVDFMMKVQQPEASVGRVIPIRASLQSHALFTLKGVYKACGYNPGPEGHDPEKVLDGEFWFYLEHTTYNGEPNINIPAWSIRSVQDGPGKKTPAPKPQAVTA